jgi:conjugative transposon TraJ protein
MYRKISFIAILAASFVFPLNTHAQVVNGVTQLHQVLDGVYNQMIPLANNLLQLCQSIAGMGCIFYIGVRVWKHIARAEPIDTFPLFRPFVMVLLISLFPQVLAVINGILSPSVTATSAMVQHSNDAVQALLLAQENQLVGGDTSAVLMTPNPQGSQQGWDKYAQPGSTDSGGGGGFWSAIGNGFKFLAGGVEASFRFIFRYLLSIILQVLYFAAALCIDTIRTYHLIVLAILGPFAFAFSCYDGFQQSLVHWLAKYINVYLWLPIANLFGAILGQIQQNMIQIDLARVQNGTTSLFSATDIAYLIFLLIGVVGYTTVPSLSNYIVHSHLPNTLLQKVSGYATTAVTATAGAVTGGASLAATGAASAASSASGGTDYNSKGQPYDPQQYNRDRISG